MERERGQAESEREGERERGRVRERGRERERERELLLFIITCTSNTSSRLVSLYIFTSDVSRSLLRERERATPLVHKGANVARDDRREKRGSV